MYASFDAARLHREELDREIDTIRTERLLRSATASGPSLPGRARAGIGRGLISLGTALLGTTEGAADRPRTAGSSGRA